MFHKTNPNAQYRKYFFGLNEYATEQEALDIALNTEPELKQAYETYLRIHDAVMSRNQPKKLAELLENYRPSDSPMDQAIKPLKANRSSVIARSRDPIQTVLLKASTV